MRAIKAISILATIVFLNLNVQSAKANSLTVEHDEDVIKQSIIYDKKTPDVFYCPQEKPNGINNMMVKSKPLHKLCEYQGQELPEGYKSDCYGNVDESLWACKEKKRIMKRKYPPAGMDILEKYEPLSRSKRAEYYNMANPRSKKGRVITSVSQSQTSSSSSKSRG